MALVNREAGGQLERNLTLFTLGFKMHLGEVDHKWTAFNTSVNEIRFKQKLELSNVSLTQEEKYLKELFEVNTAIVQSTACF